MFYYILLFFVLTSVTTRKKDCAGKKDWGIRIGESVIKFERTVELKIANEQTFIEIVIKQWEMIVLTWQCRI